MESGVAHQPIEDFEAYKDALEARLRDVMGRPMLAPYPGAFAGSCGPRPGRKRASGQGDPDRGVGQVVGELDGLFVESRLVLRLHPAGFPALLINLLQYRPLQIIERVIAKT